MSSTETDEREYKATGQHNNEPHDQDGEYGHLTTQRQYSWDNEYQKIGNIVIALGRSKTQNIENKMFICGVISCRIEISDFHECCAPDD